MKACSVAGCARPHFARGHCEAHYKRAKEGRPLDAPMRAPRVRRDGPCDVPGCWKQRYRGAVCSAHWLRKMRGREDWATPLRVKRVKAERTDVGRVRVDLVRRLDRIAKSRGLTRAFLVERVLEEHFAQQQEET